jgi:hypothetical protein
LQVYFTGSDRTVARQLFSGIRDRWAFPADYLECADLSALWRYDLSQQVCENSPFQNSAAPSREKAVTGHRTPNFEALPG